MCTSNQYTGTQKNRQQQSRADRGWNFNITLGEFPTKIFNSQVLFTCIWIEFTFLDIELILQLCYYLTRYLQ